MLLSVITVTLNDAVNLKSTLDSVLNQKYDGVEHIVIDGGSADGTVELLENYQNKYNLTWISEKDNGISDAFNKGVKMSSGKWVLFLGAGDTLINNNIITDVDKELLSKPNHTIIWGDVDVVDSSGNIIKEIKGNHNKHRLKQYMCYHHQGIFHNRKSFENHGLFDKDFRIAMDYDFLLRLYDEIDVSGYLNRKVSCFLSGGNSQLNYLSTIHDFFMAQKKNKTSQPLLLKMLYYWSAIKYFIKIIISRYFNHIR